MSSLQVVHLYVLMEARPCQIATFVNVLRSGLVTRAQVNK